MATDKITAGALPVPDKVPAQTQVPEPEKAQVKTFSEGLAEGSKLERAKLTELLEHATTLGVKTSDVKACAAYPVDLAKDYLNQVAELQQAKEAVQVSEPTNDPVDVTLAGIQEASARLGGNNGN